MAIIQNSAVMQKLVDELGLSPALEKIPTELADKILPVFQVNSEELIIKQDTNVKNLFDETAGAGYTKTITVPADKKWRLLHASCVYTASADVNTRSLRFQIKDSAGNNLFISDASATFIASQTYELHLSPHMPVVAVALATRIDGGMLPEGFFEEGTAITFWDSSGSAEALDRIKFTLIVEEQDE